MQLSSSVGEVRVWWYVGVQSCAFSLRESHFHEGLARCTVLLSILNNIFVETDTFLCILWWIYIKKHLFEIKIFHKIINSIDIYQCSASLLNAEFLNSSVLCVFNISCISSGLPRNPGDPQPTWQRVPDGRTCCRDHPDPQQSSSLLHSNHTVRAERVEEHKKDLSGPS